MIKKTKNKIAVVIPCYRVKSHIKKVLSSIGPEVSAVYVIDDGCPEKSGEYVQSFNRDKRVNVLFHEKNKGVGGAVLTGYRKAAKEGADVIVKIDGDGQMDPGLIKYFVKPILERRADYTKGNRFYNVEFLRKMPVIRLLGNSFLSFINKIVSGYWDIMDPTNGYTAIDSHAVKLLPLDKIQNRYFFESDMLFRLGTIRAVVMDIPMNSVYDDEISNLNIKRVMMEFPLKYANRFFKRIFYQYFLRDFNAGTVEFLSGMILVIAGGIFGIYKWMEASDAGIPATSGVVMLAAFPLLVGTQLLISAVNYDIYSVPKISLNSLKNKE